MRCKTSFTKDNMGSFIISKLNRLTTIGISISNDTLSGSLQYQCSLFPYFLSNHRQISRVRIYSISAFSIQATIHIRVFIVFCNAHSFQNCFLYVSGRVHRFIRRYLYRCSSPSPRLQPVRDSSLCKYSCKPSIMRIVR